MEISRSMRSCGCTKVVWLSSTRASSATLRDSPRSLRPPYLLPLTSYCHWRHVTVHRPRLFAHPAEPKRADTAPPKDPPCPLRLTSDFGLGRHGHQRYKRFRSLRQSVCATRTAGILSSAAPTPNATVSSPSTGSVSRLS